ncbi:MAG: Abi family protein [Bacteroidia bacterium]|nr:Abi family protein [Bacteroidia bacterium]
MKYTDFQYIISPPRMGRYYIAMANNSKKAMTLYRSNLKLSQELFTVISCFEIAIRNAIDRVYINSLGNDWLRNSAAPGGIFSNPNCRIAAQTINDEVIKLSHQYTHAKLVAELGFGFWRYLYSSHQFRAGGQILLRVFPSRPTSTPAMQYNATYIFRELQKVNLLRNRIAHHEPICFLPGQPVKNTIYVRQNYALLLNLFQWMSIDEAALLYGLDHVINICNDIDVL